MELPLPAGWESLSEREKDWVLFTDWLVKTAEDYKNFYQNIGPGTSYEEDKDQDFSYKFFLSLGISRLIDKVLVIESNRPVKGEIISAAIGEGDTILFIQAEGKYGTVQPLNITALTPGEFHALDYIF